MKRSDSHLKEPEVLRLSGLNITRRILRREASISRYDGLPYVSPSVPDCMRSDVHASYHLVDNPYWRDVSPVQINRPDPLSGSLPTARPDALSCDGATQSRKPA
jgi:hypothetical protein